MDERAACWLDLAEAFNLALLSSAYAHGKVDFGALPCGYMPTDWDAFVMNNADTKKEAIGRTYQGVDGYAPSVACLGQSGYCLQLALRPGVQHSANETEFNLERILPMVAQLTPIPLLFRADAENAQASATPFGKRPCHWMTAKVQKKKVTRTHRMTWPCASIV